MKSSWQIALAALGTVAGILLGRRVLSRGGAAPVVPGANGMSPSPFAGPVDAYAPWETTKEGDCDPTPKPGVLLFRTWVLGKWGEKAGSPQNIVRDCSIGGPSEHKEGRAWDLMTTSIEHGDSILDALMAPDPVSGEPHALARRAGLMYVIWNRRMWRAYPWQGKPSGDWEPYTAGEAASPHVDHIHFSFSKAGANGTTSLYDALRAGQAIA